MTVLNPALMFVVSVSSVALAVGLKIAALVAALPVLNPFSSIKRVVPPSASAAELKPKAK